MRPLQLWNDGNKTNPRLEGNREAILVYAQSLPINAAFYRDATLDPLHLERATGPHTVLVGAQA